MATQLVIYIMSPKTLKDRFSLLHFIPLLSYFTLPFNLEVSLKFHGLHGQEGAMKLDLSGTKSVHIVNMISHSGKGFNDAKYAPKNIIKVILV